MKSVGVVPCSWQCHQCLNTDDVCVCVCVFLLELFLYDACVQRMLLCRRRRQLLLCCYRGANSGGRAFWKVTVKVSGVWSVEGRCLSASWRAGDLLKASPAGSGHSPSSLAPPFTRSWPGKGPLNEFVVMFLSNSLSWQLHYKSGCCQNYRKK